MTTYADLIKSFAIVCPECGGELEIVCGGEETTLSPLLKCKSENCGATFRPEIQLYRSVENLIVKGELTL